LYDFLRGKVVESQPGRVILEVGGIGFKLTTPDSTCEKLRIDAVAQLWTHLIFREDNIGLYGFSSRRERELFLILLKVSGVGPRLAIQILSGIQPVELIRAMQNEDWKRLTLISGIGPKTAKRLLIELKEVLTSQELRLSPSGGAPTDPVLSQAFSALQSLGFEHDAIRNVLRDVSPDKELETIIREALTKLSS